MDLCIYFLILYLVVRKKNNRFLPRDAMQAWPMPSCGVCLCVHLSVTFVDSAKMNKQSFKIFSPFFSHTILIFLY